MCGYPSWWCRWVWRRQWPDPAKAADVRESATGPLVYGATTYSAGSAIGTASKNDLRNIRDFVLDYVDIFSNDYLAANPPEAQRSDTARESQR